VNLFSSWSSSARLVPAILLVIASAPVCAQLSVASVSGTVEDPSGARLTAVSIKLLNLQTGGVNLAVTDAEGEFLIPGVLPGAYSMQVQRDGFAALHLIGLNLSIGEERRFRIRLQVGNVEQSVEVNAEGQNLVTADAEMSTVVNSHLTANLPLNGRSFQDLVAMTPGSVEVSPQVPRNGGFSVNGQPVDTNTYWIDGVSANFGSGPADTDLKVPAAGQYASVTSQGTTQGLVSLDALQEFRVIASNASAEYGGTPGGQFSLLTRQGTDRVHATAYSYLRNGYFDATNWFAGYTGIRASAYYHQQDIGGSLSLPIVFSPKARGEPLANFFGSYEELHAEQRTPPVFEYVPNARLCQAVPAALQAALSSFPCYSLSTEEPPQLEHDYDGNVPSQPGFIKSMDIRLDRNFKGHLAGFIRFGDSPSGSESADLDTITNTKFQNQSLAVGLDEQISSKAGNEFRLGWGRSSTASVSSNQVSNPFSQAVDLPAVLGSPGPSAQSRAEIYIRALGLGETSAWVDSGENALRQFEVRDTFSIQHEHHLLRMGFDLLNDHSAVVPLPWTIEADYLSLDSLLNNSADLLIERRVDPAHPVFQRFASFVQDNWRATRQVNVSAGLRWDIDPPPHSSDSNDAFRVDGDPSQPNSLSITPRGTALWRTDWRAVAPRLSFAWQPSQQTGNELVFRGGLGVLFDSPDRAVAPAFTAMGFSTTSSAARAAVPFAAASAPPPDVPGPDSLGYLFPRTLRSPYTLQWNLSLEQALGKQQSVTLSYVGANGHSLLVPHREAVDSTTFPIRELVTFPAGVSSQYDSLQFSYRGQISSQLAWIASYVWSHAIDTAAPNPWAALSRANADTDVRHNLQTGVVWTLPQVHGISLLHNAFSGWGFDSRIFLRSSYPVNVLGNLFYDPVTAERFYTGADLVAGLPIYLSNPTLPGGRMLNGGPNAPDGAFQLPSGNAQGNAPRNLARGFPAQQVSLALRRDIHLYKDLCLQLRGDVFNISNSPDFGYIDSHLTDQLFGQPVLTLNQSYGQTGSLYQTGGPRSVQWMFRIHW
jgi:hypothetical protein